MAKIKLVKDVFTDKYKKYWLKITDIELMDTTDDEDMEMQYIIYRDLIHCYYENGKLVFIGSKWVSKTMKLYTNFLDKYGDRRILDIDIDDNAKQIFIDV
jgi:hypothetical protein